MQLLEENPVKDGVRTTAFPEWTVSVCNNKQQQSSSRGEDWHLPFELVNMTNVLLISDRAHLLFDLHKEIDGLREAELAGSGKAIGTTKRGIGPAYASKATRNGVRACDLFDMESFPDKVRKLAEEGAKRFGEDWTYDVEADIDNHVQLAEIIKPYIIDTVEYINDARDEGKRILIEGANATMLDLDFGTYPFVTSSNPSIGGIASGLGLAPNKYNALVGVVKAYTTRVGAGPYPTELFGTQAEELREIGREYGTTTGRPRRIGWMDTVALRFVCRINGLTHLNLTKLDVLSELDEIKIGVAYKTKDGRSLNMVPADLRTLEEVEVVYETMPGWKSDISGARQWDDLPQKAKDYVNRLEELIGIHYKWIGVGPGRDAMVVKELIGIHYKWIGVGLGRDVKVVKELIGINYKWIGVGSCRAAMVVKLIRLSLDGSNSLKFEKSGYT
eukprot:gene6345-2971_t